MNVLQLTTMEHAQSDQIDACRTLPRRRVGSGSPVFGSRERQDTAARAAPMAVGINVLIRTKTT